MTQFIINKRTDASKTDVNLLRRYCDDGDNDNDDDDDDDDKDDRDYDNDLTDSVFDNDEKKKIQNSIPHLPEQIKSRK